MVEKHIVQIKETHSGNSRSKEGKRLKAKRSLRKGEMEEAEVGCTVDGDWLLVKLITRLA
jgi:hypothetical protein